MAPRVKINESGAPQTPAQELVQAAAKDVLVRDGARQITLRRPGILAQVGLIRLLGAEDAANEVLRSMYAPTLYVSAIDGDPIFPSQTRLQLDALLERLDEGGLVAVMAGVQKHFGGNAKESLDALKN